MTLNYHLQYFSSGFLLILIILLLVLLVNPCPRFSYSGPVSRRPQLLSSRGSLERGQPRFPDLRFSGLPPVKPLLGAICRWLQETVDRLLESGTQYALQPSLSRCRYLFWAERALVPPPLSGSAAPAR